MMHGPYAVSGPDPEGPGQTSELQLSEENEQGLRAMIRRGLAVWLGTLIVAGGVGYYVGSRMSKGVDSA